MNTRSHDMEMVVAARQVEEVTKALFHTILLHRTTGKYEYSSRHSGTFSVGVVGMEDVDLSTLDFTYVSSSPPLPSSPLPSPSSPLLSPPLPLPSSPLLSPPLLSSLHMSLSFVYPDPALRRGKGSGDY
ncbi:Autophagy-related protein 101 [Geodia barretti]|uniref:Autophagy-related protein 101 n=1 Tax=Geodia barretti TaxID=519541 RepID=A0AA35WUB0_GEOBA|nr:Autophagy-related protein 101 [Geodia barretti]